MFNRAWFDSQCCLTKTSVFNNIEEVLSRLNFEFFYEVNLVMPVELKKQQQVTHVSPAAVTDEKKTVLLIMCSYT